MHSPQRFVTFTDSPVTVAAGDRVIYCNCTGGNIVLNFPTAVSKPARFFEIVKTDATANKATITPTGGQTVNGAATFDVTTQFQTVAVVSNNSNYTIFYGSSSGSSTPSGPAGGDLSGTYPNPKVAAITETSGPTDLVIGSIATTELLQRVGATLVGLPRAGSDSSAIHSGSAAGGDLAGTYPNPKVAAITETSGPTDLVIGAIADGDFLKRVGATLIGATPSGGGGGSGVWELIQTQTLLADTDTIDFLTLNGEFDGYYFLDYTIIKGAAGSVSGSLQPNAISTNQRTESLTFGTALAPSQSSVGTGMFIYGSGGSVGDAQRGTITFWPKTGLPRSGLGELLEASVGFNSAYRQIATITWLETVTAITSLRIKGSVANSFKTGSVLSLYKVTPTSSGSSASDFEFSFSGTLSTVQNDLIPVKTQRNAVTVDRLDVELQVAPTGQAAIFEFFYGVTSLGTVTVAASSLSGSTTITPVSIPAGTRVKSTINQVGSVVVGETATMYVRSA